VREKSNFSPEKIKVTGSRPTREREYKMTKREFMEAIVNGTMNEEIQAMAATELEKMDAANAKRRERVSKKAQENAPLVDQIVNEILGEEPLTATDIAAAMGISVQKASALARAAVKDGRVNATDVKVTGKGMQKGYTLA